ncbi:unnamed protein product [Musa acuminata subsp. burmannicoides]
MCLGGVVDATHGVALIGLLLVLSKAYMADPIVMSWCLMIMGFLHRFSTAAPNRRVGEDAYDRA